MSHYWNKAAFESLAQLAEDLRQTPGLARVAEYCVLREKGLRKQALAAIHLFLAESARLCPAKRLALAIRLLDLHYAAPAAHQFLCQPLQDDFIRPALRIEARPGNTAFRCLALLNSSGGTGRAALRVALKHAPADMLVRKKLLALLLGDAEYSMHHLGESLFIGSEEYCRKVLDEAAVLLASPLTTHEAFSGLRWRHTQLAALFADWLAYSKGDRRIPFPEWCAGKGRDHTWSITVYYSA